MVFDFDVFLILWIVYKFCYIGGVYLSGFFVVVFEKNILIV